VTQRITGGQPGTEDRIILQGMRFEGRHGVSAEERALPQLIEVDVELATDLRAAGGSDELSRTIDYGPVYRLCKSIVEERSYRMLEAIAEAIARETLSATTADSLVVRVRKPGVPIDGDIDFAGVEIRRVRARGREEGRGPGSS
jgi:7,8-dihydroneopterin aldolase/epimerase/oxygenase